MKLSSKKFLILITLLAGILRFINLANNPPSLYWDEASIGYNAFAILKAGIDEHGVKYPLTNFLAFGDAKPPLYIYAVSVSFAIFQVGEFAIRLPSALAGSLAIPVTFYLVLELLKYFKTKSPRLTTTKSLKLIPTISAILLAISPWHIQMSRAGFEANLALTLFLFGLLLFFKAISNHKLFVPSAIFFALTLYTFNAYRIFVPLFILFTTVVCYHKLSNAKKWITISFITGTILLSPLIPFTLSEQAKLRYNEVTIFKNHEPILEANLRNSINNNIISKFIHNRRVLFGLEFLKHYTDHFKPDFLFFSGDVNPRLSARDTAGLYIIELPLLLLGTYLIAKSNQKLGIFLFGWILIGIIPAAIARETPHALRILQIFPTLQIVIAFALAKILFANKKAFMLVLSVYAFLFLFYINLYHFHYPKHWAPSWQYGYKQMVNYVSEHETSFDRIYITKYLGRPHSYLLFYQQTDPINYVNTRNAGGDAFGFTFVNSFGKYHFGDPPQKPTDSNESWLVVSGPNTQPKNHLTTINDLNNNPVFVIHKI